MTTNRNETAAEALAQSLIKTRALMARLQAEVIRLESLPAAEVAKDWGYVGDVQKLNYDLRCALRDED
jgi:hypothetical protein